jgi:hypothetical protein
MLLNTIGLQRTPAMTRSKEEPMTSPKDATPPTEARLPTPAERPTWVELVNQERRLLDGLVQFWRARSRHPPADVEKIVARALEEALQECIAEEKDDERADEMRRRAAARALAAMYLRGPRLVYTRPLPIQAKTIVARPDNKPRRKPEVESFQAMLDERRRRRPHLVIDNTRQPDEVAPAA